VLPRREFLALAATAATASAEAKPIGIGFIGASYSHAAGKLKVVQKSSDWKLVGVNEADPKIQQELQAQGIQLMSRQQLLDDPDVQVIAVESRVADHASDGKAVLNAGKHLHLEKAPADHMADFREIVELAAKKRLVLQMGYMWRYHPGIGAALDAAQKGWLGSVFLLRASMSNQLAADRRAEWGEFPGGVMFELGCHVIDPMVRLMGRPAKVTPALRTDSSIKDSLRDNCVAVLEWGNAMGIVHASTLQANSSRYRAFEIYGTNGSAIVNPIEPPAMVIDMAKAAGPYKAGKQTIPMPDYQRFVADFANLASVLRGEGRFPSTSEVDLNVEDALLRCSGMA
jgi:predicted dehydrogenase